MKGHLAYEESLSTCQASSSGGQSSIAAVAESDLERAQTSVLCVYKLCTYIYTRIYSCFCSYDIFVCITYYN